MTAWDAQEFASLLEEGVHMFGQPNLVRAVPALSRHARLVLEWNERAGLTSIVDARGMAAKHYLDAIALFRGVLGVSELATLVDVGAGAGFPGMVLAICAGGLEVTFLEASAKKAEFLRVAATDLGVRGNVVHVRAEDFGRVLTGPGREAFDFGVARAAAAPAVACEYVLPLVRPGGYFLAQLGPGDGAAVERYLRDQQGHKSTPPWAVLGAEVREVSQHELPWDFGRRYVATFRKLRNTPAKYPRKPGIPQRKPLPGFPE